MNNILMAVFGILMAILSVYFVGNQKGRESENTAQNEKVLEDAEIDYKARANNDSLSVDEQLNELRQDVKSE